jgi:hypothetical protein
MIPTEPRQRIRLSDREPFAVGGFRACYVHPENRARCLKVVLPGKGAADRRREDSFIAHFRPDWHYDENLHEARFLELLEKQLGCDATAHFILSHGFTETDLGAALETDLVRDPDDVVSITAKEYIVQNGFDDAAHSALEQLHRFLLRRRVLVRDPFVHNILFQKQADASLRAVIVDGLGNAEFIPFSEWIPALARRKINRKFAKTMRSATRAAEAHSGERRINSKGMRHGFAD